MANNIGSLAVQITGNSAGLTKALQQAETGVKHSMGKIAAIATGVGAGLFAGFSLGSFIVDSIKIAGEMEDISASFKTMTGSATEGEQLFRDIEDASDAMRMNVKDTAEAAKGLFSADVASDQIVPTLKVLGDLALGDAEKLKALSNAYAKVAEDGSVTTRTLKAFAGANVFLGNEIAKAMGLDKDEFKQALEDGKVGLRDLQAAMLAATGEGGKFFGGIAAKMETFKGKLDALSNMWDDFKWDLGKILIDELGLKGLLDALTTGLGAGRENLDAIRPIIRSIKGLAIEMGKALFAAFANAAIAAAELANAIKSIKMFGNGQGSMAKVLGPGASILPAANKMIMGGSSRQEGDIFDTRKLSEELKKLGDMFEGFNTRVGGVSGISRADALRQMGEEAKKAGDAFKLAAIAATNADKAFVKSATEKAFPVASFKNEMKELREKANRGAFNVQGGGIAADQAMADVFDKFVKDFGSAVQLSSVALQDSADAVSAISQHRMGGRMDPQARAAAALDQLVEIEKQNQKINEAKAAAMQNWIIKNGPLP